MDEVVEEYSAALSRLEPDWRASHGSVIILKLTSSCGSGPSIHRCPAQSLRTLGFPRRWIGLISMASCPRMKKAFPAGNEGARSLFFHALYRHVRLHVL